MVAKEESTEVKAITRDQSWRRMICLEMLPFLVEEIYSRFPHPQPTTPILQWKTNKIPPPPLRFFNNSWRLWNWMSGNLAWWELENKCWDGTCVAASFFCRFSVAGSKNWYVSVFGYAKSGYNIRFPDQRRLFYQDIFNFWQDIFALFITKIIGELLVKGNLAPFYLAEV